MSPSDGKYGQLQGDGATHDHIRSMQLQIGVPKAIARALQQWGSSSDEVCPFFILFSATFVTGRDQILVSA